MVDMLQPLHNLKLDKQMRMDGWMVSHHGWIIVLCSRITIYIVTQCLTESNENELLGFAEIYGVHSSLMLTCCQ